MGALQPAGPPTPATVIKMSVRSHPMTAGLRFEHVAWDDHRAAQLRQLMVAELTDLYPDLAAPSEPDQPRLLDVGPEDMVATILACADGQPVAHAAIRRSGDDRRSGDLEIKRVYVRTDARGAGVAGALMAEVESTARQLRARRLILHTGDRQPAAVRLYRRLGYAQIPLYEPYASTMPGSFCFELVL